MILKLFAGIEIVARPVTFDMVANDAAVTFGVTFEMTFGAIAFPTTGIVYVRGDETEKRKEETIEHSKCVSQ